MEMLALLTIPVGLVSLACWIYTIVVAFQKGSVVLGIVSICPLVGFILGWVKNGEWGHQKVMIVWSICIVINLILNVLVAATAAS